MRNSNHREEFVPRPIRVPIRRLFRPPGGMISRELSLSRAFLSRCFPSPPLGTNPLGRILGSMCLESRRQQILPFENCWSIFSISFSTMAEFLEHRRSRSCHRQFVSGVSILSSFCFRRDIVRPLVERKFDLDLFYRNSNQTRFESAATNINIVSLHKTKEPNPKSLT